MPDASSENWGTGRPRFDCPFLEVEVLLPSESERHVLGTHRELSGVLIPLLGATLGAPDAIRLSTRTAKALLFARWYPELLGGKHVVAVVIKEPPLAGCSWIVTCYVARKLSGGIPLWSRN